MPPHGNLERLIGTALVDGEFQADLLGSPAIAARGFNLSPEELEVLSSAKACTLEELSAYVYAWITNAPRPKRTVSSRWILEGYPAVRVAV